jgi:tetratricopeptide (TPR) repeat protein
MLQEVISTLSVQNKAKVIMIMDACRAGKLSGSAINGNQLTNSNLAKQYANEIKILSCQPNEYSLEGTQWGGGRGAFSYHLINALYGLADNNSDNIVNLKEVSRYLEDEVSKEVSPQSQNPMVIGSATEKLSDVNFEILTALKNGKKDQTQFFSAVESRGIEDEVLASIDSNNVKIYRAFQKALKDKQFLFAENGRDKNDYADYYYNKLITDPQLERLHSTMTRNFAAALQDDAQQILNLSSKSELKEMLVDRDKKARKYLNFAKNLDRAAELLGKSHYMYASLIARKFFFEGWSMSLLHRNADAISGMQALEKFKNSLQWQSDFPQCYYQIAWIYAINLPNADSCEFYANRAAELSPSWVIPYSGLGQLLTEKFNLFDKAKYYFDLALKIDSASAYTWNNLGNYYFYQKQFQHADENYFKAIRYDSTYVDPYYNLACSMSLQNQNEKAYQYLELALKIGYDYNWIHKDADLYELRKDSERWNVLMKKYFPDKIKDK